MRLSLWSGLAVAALAHSGLALAAGTPANTPILNTATVSYTDANGQSQTEDSNTVSLRVDEILGVTVANNDGGNVSVNTPEDDKPMRFTVTNPGNGNEAYFLSVDLTAAGAPADQYDPTGPRIFIDDGDGIFEPLQDTLYTPGTPTASIAPDGSIVVFVTSDTPAGRANGDLGRVNLTATAVTGSGTPGDTFLTQGDGGVDAVVGNTTATDTDTGTFIVTQVQTDLVKSQTVLDPFGGSNAVPNAVVTYTLTLNVTGAGTLTAASISDDIPTNTTYVANSITLGGVALTDSTADADAGRFTGTSVVVNLGNLTVPPSPLQRVVTFKVRIN